MPLPVPAVLAGTPNSGSYFDTFRNGIGAPA